MMMFNCVTCGDLVRVNVNVVKFQEWSDLPNSTRPHIQDYFPELSADERELIISSICGTCFDSIMGDE